MRPEEGEQGWDSCDLPGTLMLLQLGGILGLGRPPGVDQTPVH